MPLVADWHCLAHARICKRHLVAMQAQAVYKRIHSDQMTGSIIRDLEILGLVDPMKKETTNNVVEAQSYIHEVSFQKELLSNECSVDNKSNRTFLPQRPLPVAMT